MAGNGPISTPPGRPAVPQDAPRPPKTVEDWEEMSGEEQDALIASGWHPAPLPHRLNASPSPVSAADCICYPGMCPQGCEPACPYCFQPSRAWLEGAAAISLCPRCEGQEYDVGSCGLCRNTGLLDGNGNSYRQAPGFEVTPRQFIERYTP